MRVEQKILQKKTSNHKKRKRERKNGKIKSLAIK